MTTNRHGWRRSERGAAIVEFALIAMALIVLVLGIIQFGLVMFTFNSAAEATRHGARVAAINAPFAREGSDPSYSVIVRAMEPYLVNLAENNVVICYGPSEAAAEWVLVRLARENEQGNPGCDCECNSAGAEPYGVVPWFFWPVEQISVPQFATALPRESLGSN